ncbi:LysR family transcriptional regulator [Patulibacter brassicae]|uniref:LysR family transcriptional regulator n=1 Tax=Patulibacter brassicae TaxID=1705717 RepID=A0ABU4VHZ5_9ACTN|nr:LysR family transcriptional regulator [Patulibacter brassicae]MDX8150769.1 LysR family transcriptional regulator [Patulibacter brassicae]
MNPRHLEYLVALEGERHFGRAAERCHVTQPTLSAGIQALEAALGLPLVRRGRRYEGLTPEGERVLRWARRIVADQRDLADDVARLRGEGGGVLRVGAIPTTLPAVSRVASRLLREHPGLRVELRSATSRELERDLDGFALDLAATYLDAEVAHGRRAWALYAERYRLVASGTDAAALAGRDAVRWDELGGLRLCLLTPEMQNRRIIDRALEDAGVAPEVALETDSLSALLAHVQDGWSSIVADRWTPLLTPPADARVLPIVAPELRSPVGLVALDRDPPVPMVAAFAAAAGATPLGG